jgi:hypothetical protein
LRKEEKTMRYTLAMLLALVLGVSAMIQASFAAEREGPQTPVSAVTAQYGSDDSGTISGPVTPSYQVPAVEHELNRN